MPIWDVGLGQKLCGGRWPENPVCVVFLQKVTCTKPRLLARKPRGRQKSRKTAMCRWRCPWTRWVAGPPPSGSISPCRLQAPPPPLPPARPASRIFCALSSQLRSTLRSCIARSLPAPLPGGFCCCWDPPRHLSQSVTAELALLLPDCCPSPRCEVGDGLLCSRALFLMGRRPLITAGG